MSEQGRARGFGRIRGSMACEGAAARTEAFARRRWRDARALLATTLFVVCACTLLPATASAAGTGTIEGTVTRAEAPKAGEGIEGLCVRPLSASGSEEIGGIQLTQSNGAYKLTEVPAGEWKVEFADCTQRPELNYAPQFSGGSPTLTGATSVTVEAGKTTTVNAAMTVGAKLYGTVANEAGGYLRGVCVSVSPAESAALPEGGGFASTNSEGEFEIVGLAETTYTVDYEGCEAGIDVVPAFLDQEAGPDFRTGVYANASKVALKVGETPLEVDLVRLQKGAEIQGTIADAAGQPITKAFCLHAEGTGEALGDFGFGFTESGHYVIEGLASGSYVLEADECEEGPAEWATQFYAGASTKASATKIALTAGVEPVTPFSANFTMIRTDAVKPANTAVPVVSGTAAAGGTLACSTGTWTGTPAPTYAYQWLRNGSAIGGATSSSYAVTATDEGASLSCMVTASNEAGSATATSGAVTVAVPPPPPPPPPAKEEPKPTPKPGEAFALGKTTVTRGAVTFTLVCKGGGPCEGSLQLTALLTVKHGKRHKTKKVKIGSASFTIAAAGREQLEVKLTGKGAGYLSKAGRRGLKVQLTGSDFRTRKLVLKLKPKHGKHKRKAKGKHKH